MIEHRSGHAIRLPPLETLYFFLSSLACLAQHARPDSVLSSSSFHPRSFSPPNPPISHPSPNPLHPRALPEPSTHARPGPSSPPSTWYTPPPGLSSDTHPSSSGAFTPIALPPNWTIYPASSHLVLRPVLVAAAALERFYTDIIAHCASNFWSATPDAPLWYGNLRFGALLLTVVGGEGSPGLPWDVLALLAQGMLERVRRGWTSTWDGKLHSPTGDRYRVILSIADDEPDLECEEEDPIGDSDDEAAADSRSKCKKRKTGN
ncbi:MAG: hypothetical protein Q9184_004389 [Pyrenodesmia sp. 2 TL-2023]